MCAIRLVVSDLDGTLLSEDHTLSPSVKRTVRQFVEKGGLFTFATGRPFLTAADYELELKLGLPYILCNGSIIAQKGEMIESHIFQGGDLLPLLEEADEAGLDVLLFQEKQVSVFRVTEGVRTFERKESTACRMLDRGLEEWKALDLQKVILMGDVSISRRLWDRHVPDFNGTFTGLQSESNYWEIIPGSQSKGAALRKLAERMGIRREEIMALGNQMNDLDMLHYAGIGVAVANSPDELKRHADYICSSSYGDGVVEAMERFCGL
ncbi:HAD family hydrolase [Paenibacillus sp. J5C_2022]|uniref:HAD family hydrolase n=1 Tax=Paenibacillus sp. J5C2022 TaxID=2977129 RepID=UPI0021D397AC|nr:HAD family hydrolase [Paenibacillus sp. J5C2022]MCU6711745.1 HAD family hydrolase [Paenibacillus sp. J5C2022]